MVDTLVVLFWVVACIGAGWVTYLSWVAVAIYLTSKPLKIGLMVLLLSALATAMFGWAVWWNIVRF